MIKYVMKHECAAMSNIFQRLPFYDYKRYILEGFKASHHPSTSFCFHFFDLQLSLSYFTFICVLLFLYSSFINFCFLFFRFLAFLCFILLYFLLTNDLRGAAPEPIIPNIPLTRSVNVGLIASRSLVS